MDFFWPFKDIHWDLDGTLTGTADAYLTPYKPWLEDPQCTKQSDDVYSQVFPFFLAHCNFFEVRFSQGTICTGVAVRRLQVDEVEPRELDWRPVMLKGQNAKVFFGRRGV